MDISFFVIVLLGNFWFCGFIMFNKFIDLNIILEYDIVKCYDFFKCLFLLLYILYNYMVL